MFNKNQNKYKDSLTADKYNSTLYPNRVEALDSSIESPSYLYKGSCLGTTKYTTFISNYASDIEELSQYVGGPIELLINNIQFIRNNFCSNYPKNLHNTSLSKNMTTYGTLLYDIEKPLTIPVGSDGDYLGWSFIPNYLRAILFETVWKFQNRYYGTFNNRLYVSSTLLDWWFTGTAFDRAASSALVYNDKVILVFKDDYGNDGNTNIEIQVSSDSINFEETRLSSSYVDEFNKIGVCNGTIVQGSGTIYYSTDSAETWTAATLPTEVAAANVAIITDKECLGVGHSEDFSKFYNIRSTDGKTWGLCSYQSEAYYFDPCYSGDIYAVSCVNSNLYAKKLGEDSEPVKIAEGAYILDGYAKGNFYVHTSANVGYIISENSINLTDGTCNLQVMNSIISPLVVRTLTSANCMTKIVLADDVVFGNSGNFLMYSFDGNSFQAVDNPPSSWSGPITSASSINPSYIGGSSQYAWLFSTNSLSTPIRILSTTGSGINATFTYAEEYMLPKNTKWVTKNPLSRYSDTLITDRYISKSGINNPWYPHFDETSLGNNSVACGYDIVISANSGNLYYSKNYVDWNRISIPTSIDTNAVVGFPFTWKGKDSFYVLAPTYNRVLVSDGEDINSWETIDISSYVRTNRFSVAHTHRKNDTDSTKPYLVLFAPRTSPSQNAPDNYGRCISINGDDQSIRIIDLGAPGCWDQFHITTLLGRLSIGIFSSFYGIYRSTSQSGPSASSDWQFSNTAVRYNSNVLKNAKWLPTGSRYTSNNWMLVSGLLYNLNNGATLSPANSAITSSSEIIPYSRTLNTSPKLKKLIATRLRLLNTNNSISNLFSSSYYKKTCYDPLHRVFYATCGSTLSSSLACSVDCIHWQQISSEVTRIDSIVYNNSYIYFTKDNDNFLYRYDPVFDKFEKLTPPSDITLPSGTSSNLVSFKDGVAYLVGGQLVVYNTNKDKFRTISSTITGMSAMGTDGYRLILCDDKITSLKVMNSPAESASAYSVTLSSTNTQSYSKIAIYCIGKTWHVSAVGGEDSYCCSTYLFNNSSNWKKETNRLGTSTYCNVLNNRWGNAIVYDKELPDEFRTVVLTASGEIDFEDLGENVMSCSDGRNIYAVGPTVYVLVDALYSILHTSGNHKLSLYKPTQLSGDWRCEIPLKDTSTGLSSLTPKVVGVRIGDILKFTNNKNQKVYVVSSPDDVEVLIGTSTNMSSDGLCLVKVPSYKSYSYSINSIGNIFLKEV